MGSYKTVASRLADEALARCAKVLEERDREGEKRAIGEGLTGDASKEAEGGEEGEGGRRIGRREVLRGLSRTIAERG